MVRLLPLLAVCALLGAATTSVTTTDTSAATADTTHCRIERLFYRPMPWHPVGKLDSLREVAVELNERARSEETILTDQGVAFIPESWAGTSHWIVCANLRY
jgi:hypothetical protein